MSARVLAVLALLAVCTQVLAASSKELLGTWEAARSPDGERLYVRLFEKGKAEVIAEYDFSLPGQPARRGRSTTMAKWSLHGNELTISYAKVRDHLRYNPKAPLSEVGLQGSAPALTPIGQADANSRLRGAILWRGPHDYQLKVPEPTAEQKK